MVMNSLFKSTTHQFLLGFIFEHTRVSPNFSAQVYARIFKFQPH